jgi:hypothetical protein
MEPTMDIENNAVEDQQFTPSSYEENLIHYHFEFIKSLLYRIRSKNLQYPDCHVIRITGKSDGFLHKPKLISVTIEKSTGFIRIIDNYITATLLFEKQLYDISMYVGDRHQSIVQFTIVVLGLDPLAKQSEELIYFLKRESVRNSPYRDQMLQVLVDKSAYAESIGDIYVEAAKISEDSLGDIYLPAQINDHVQLFIKSVIHYNESKRPLRYLFAGKPGTAKTKIIRAIAKACAGKATFIFSTGNERRIESLFEFAEMFSPVVLCIDDIDLMTGSRSEGLYTPRLASFLQKLDGFVRQDFFLLATTNDKRLVDLAASRPGRFDLVIDVNLIEPRQYLELVKSKTQNIDIINLFDNEVLSLLEVKKVTGAFIANIVKHLELIALFESQKMSREYLATMIRESHQGFYEEPEPTNGRVGFQLS